MPAGSFLRDFARRYHAEKVRLGPALSDLLLQAHRGQGDESLCAWLAGLSVQTLSDALELVLERQPLQQQFGAYSTGADVAAFMARRTLGAFLLADHVVPHAELLQLLVDNRDLWALLLEWVATAPVSRVRNLLSRLQALTVLDPTCGTGPFLIAALRLLAPLEQDCLRRLGLRASSQAVRQRLVQQTLFGVDLLPEAVELCRLRLRLEGGGEPANNIRLGNCLDETWRAQGIGPRLSGFDVVLGNPPYQELREVPYTLQGFRCQNSGAIHALCIERSLELLRPGGWISMLVPMSLVSTQRMQCVQDLLEEGRHVWYANYSWRPGRLFPGVNRAITLFLATRAARPRTWTTGYQKWHTRDRPRLFESLRFVESPRDRPSFWIPKLSHDCERSLLDRFLAIPTRVADFLEPTKHPDRRIYYRTDGGLYWKVFTDFAPTFSCNGKAGSSTRETWVTVRKSAFVAPLIAALSSDVFWWWYTLTSNCRHLNPSDVQSFPLPGSVLDDAKLARLGRAYLADLVRHSALRVRRQRQTGRTETQTFCIRKSRPILLRIGQALASHYGLTKHQSFFLASYDLDFRMGNSSSR